MRVPFLFSGLLFKVCMCNSKYSGLFLTKNMTTIYENDCCCCLLINHFKISHIEFESILYENSNDLIHQFPSHPVENEYDVGSSASSVALFWDW
jgi:hypothetical protein